MTHDVEVCLTKTTKMSGAASLAFASGSLRKTCSFTLALEDGEVQEKRESEQASLALCIDAIWPHHDKVVCCGAAFLLHTCPHLGNLWIVSIGVGWQPLKSCCVMEQERHSAASFARSHAALHAKSQATCLWSEVVDWVPSLVVLKLRDATRIVAAKVF